MRWSRMEGMQDLRLDKKSQYEAKILPATQPSRARNSFMMTLINIPPSKTLLCPSLANRSRGLLSTKAREWCNPKNKKGPENELARGLEAALSCRMTELRSQNSNKSAPAIAPPLGHWRSC